MPANTLQTLARLTVPPRTEQTSLPAAERMRHEQSLRPPIQRRNSMKRSALVLLFCASTIIFANAQAGPDWPQWGRTPQHSGSTPAVGQSPSTKLASITYDPFVAREQAEEGGELLAHYQAPLVDGNSVFLEVKTGTYVSCNPPGSGSPFRCGPDAWNSQIWNERSFAWQGGTL